MDARSENSNSVLTKSSPAILEPSKDECRSESNETAQGLFKKMLTRSLPQSSETAPIVSNVQSSDNDVEQQVHELVDEPGNCCPTVYNCYKNSVLKFRNSEFICIVQILFGLLPISAIAMGTIFIENCPKAPFLPALSGVIGILGVIFITVWIVLTCLERHETPCSAKQKLAFGVAGFLVLVMTIVDAVLVFCLFPSFDPASKDYCDETFYTYAFYKEITTALVIVLSAILYVPGSRHTLCCQDCSMRSPANAFYYSL